MEIVTFYGGLVLIILFVLRFSFADKHDIVQTHETALRLSTAVTMLSISFMISLFIGIKILIMEVYESKDLEYVPLVILHLAPSFLALYSYITIPKFFRRKFVVKESTYQVGIKNLIGDLIGKYSSQLGLRKDPQIYFSAYSNIAPHVFGRNSNNASIVFPSNFEEITRRIQGQEYWASGPVIDYLVLHELSHIKNRDLGFLSWIHSFVRFFSPWCLSVILVAIITLVFGKATIFVESYYAFFLVLISFFCAKLIYSSASREREFLADARASILMSKNKRIELLSDEKAEWGGSMFGRLLEYFQFFPPFLKRELFGIRGRKGVNGASLASNNIKSMLYRVLDHIGNPKLRSSALKLYDYIFSTHPTEKERAKAFKSSDYIERATKLPSIESSIWLGVGAAGIFVFSIFFILSSKNLDIVNLANFGPSLVGDQWYVLIIYAIIVYLGATFAIPLRSSIMPGWKDRGYYLKLGFRYLVSFLAAAVSILIVILPTMYTRLEIFLIFQVYAIFWIFAIGFMISVLIAVFLTMGTEGAVFKKQNRPWLPLVTISWSCLTIAAVSCVVIIMSKTLTWVDDSEIAILTIFLSLAFGLPLMLGREQSAVDFRERYLFMVIKKKVKKVEEKLSRILLVMISRLLRITGRLCLLAAAILILVNALLGFMPELDLRWMGFRFVDSKELILFGGLVAGIVFYLNKSKKVVEQNLTDFLHRLFFLSSILPLIEKGNIECECIDKQIKKYLAKDHGVKLFRNADFSCMSCSYYGFMTLFNCGYSLNDDPELTKWVMGCETDVGGFADWKGGKPRLFSTYKALRILQTQGRMDVVDSEFHSKWIKHLQVQRGGFRSPYAKEATLENTFYAIVSLSILQRLECINIEGISKWIMTEWQHNTEDLQSTFYFLHCLHDIDQLSPSLIDELRRNWLSQKIPMLLNIRVDRSSETVYYLVSIYRILKGEELTLSDKALANLGHRVAKHLRSITESL